MTNPHWFVRSHYVNLFLTKIHHTICLHGYKGSWIYYSPRDKIAVISQTMSLEAFSWMQIFVFWLNFHWSLLLKGLRLVLDGFVVTMHEGACETGSQIPRALARVLFPQAQVHWDNKPRQIGLNPDYNMTFSISPRVCLYSSLKIRISYSKREPFRVLFPLLRHVVPLNDGNCRLTIPVIKGRCARDALPHAFHIGVFKFVKTISTAIKDI